MPGFDDAPESHVLPASDRELVEERDAVAALDGREHGAIGRTQMLVAATTRARVVDAIAGLAPAVRIAGIDESEVCQQRDEPTIALIDAVAYPMRAIDFGP